MIQTGLKQATVAYRATRETGEALDINGELVTVSGRKQAIILLTGTDNPNPVLFEVAGYFDAADLIEGAPTLEPSPDCPPLSFNVSPLSLTLSPDTPNAVVTVTSSGAWALVGAVPSGVTLSQTSGTGDASVTVTRTAAYGVGALTFKAEGLEDSIAVRFINLEGTGWLLESGAWRNYKLWKSNGLWKFNTL